MLKMSAYQIPLFPMEGKEYHSAYTPLPRTELSEEEKDVRSTLEELLLTEVSVKKMREQNREKSGRLVAYYVTPMNTPLPPFILLDARNAKNIFELSSEKESARIKRVNLSQRNNKKESLEQELLRKTALGHISLQKRVENPEAWYRTGEGVVFEEYERAYAGVLVYLVTADMLNREGENPRLVVIGGVQEVVLSSKFDPKYEGVRVKRTAFHPLHQEIISSKVGLNQDGYPSKKHDPFTREFLPKLERYASQKMREIEGKKHTHLGRYKLDLVLYSRFTVPP